MRAVADADSLAPLKNHGKTRVRAHGEAEHCDRKHFVDRGLFGITWVALLPRQRLLEKTRLPSTVQLCFCSNQGYWEDCGFCAARAQTVIVTVVCGSKEPLGSCGSAVAVVAVQEATDTQLIWVQGDKCSYYLT